MKTLLCTIALVLSVTLSFGQVEQSAYKKAIGMVQRFYNNNQPDSLYSKFSPEMKAAISIDKLQELFNNMMGQLGPMQQTTYINNIGTAAQYKADFRETPMQISLSLNIYNQIDGWYIRQYIAPAAAAQVETALDPSLKEEPVTYKSLGGTLSGTLTLPKDVQGKIPVVLIIAGSGPTDRNGNQASLKTNTYRMVAEALGKAGIASLRYDKRGVGLSTTSAKEIDMRFTDFIDDGSALVNLLTDDPRFSKVIVLGHSEGSLIGMVVCYTEKTVAGFISAAGAGQSIEFILKEQMKQRPPAVANEFNTIVDSLRKGKTTAKVDPALYDVMRPSVQPYMMSWMAFDPSKVIRRIKLPILIVQGTTDVQVSVDEAERLKKAKSDAQLVIIEGMNHILKPAPADRQANLATYTNPTLPLKPEFVTAVIDFIKKLK